MMDDRLLVECQTSGARKCNRGGEGGMESEIRLKNSKQRNPVMLTLLRNF